MKSRAIRTRRFTLISVGVIVASVGWSPAQALAADGPVDPLLGSVTQAASGTADLVDPVEGTVDQAVQTVSSTVQTVPDPLPGTVGQIADTTSNTIDTVADTTSGTVDTVSDTTSGTVDTVSGATSGSVDAVVDSTTGLVGGMTTSTPGGSGSSDASGGGTSGASTARSSTAEGSGRMGPASSTAMDARHSGAALLEAREGGAPASDIGSNPCVMVTPTACETANQTAQDSLAGAVADIIRKLLAFTGWGPLPWIAVALGLSIVGAAAVYHGGRRRPRFSGSASHS
jgi:hypothetical protein